MKVTRLALRSCSALLSLTLLFGLSSCGSNTPTSSASTSEDAIVASSVAEPPLSVVHPFAYSDATWETTPTEIENIMGKAPNSVSLAGEGKKNYVFESVEYGTIKGKCSYTFKADTLCTSTFTAESSQTMTETSNDFVENLTEVYGEATEDKTDTSDDDAGIWLNWENEDIKISYLYYLDNNKYQIVLSYALPDSKIPEIDSSNRDGDFRIGFWGDDIETINKYETAKFEGISEEDDGTTMMMYSGTVSGRSNTYITP